MRGPLFQHLLTAVLDADTMWSLADGTQTEGYWITGVMAERRFGPARLFLNFENFLDTKQSNYAPVVLGPRADPRFAEIWAPMDGFIINGGIKYTP